MCCDGAGLGGYQDVLPCIRHWSQDELRQQKRRPQVPQTCTIAIHTNHRCTYKELCIIPSKPRLIYILNFLCHKGRPRFIIELIPNKKGWIGGYILCLSVSIFFIFYIAQACNLGKYFNHLLAPSQISFRVFSHATKCQEQTFEIIYSEVSSCLASNLLLVLS